MCVPSQLPLLEPLPFCFLPTLVKVRGGHFGVGDPSSTSTPRRSLTCPFWKTGSLEYFRWAVEGMACSILPVCMLYGHVVVAGSGGEQGVA